jgi:hypothetical protein
MTLYAARPRDLSGTLATLLKCCEEFATIDVHVDRCLRKLGLDESLRPQVTAGVEALVQSGDLAPKEAFLRGLTKAAAPRTPQPRISIVGMITCDRPAALERGLLSYVRNVKHHGRDVEFVAADDSPDPASRRTNLDLLRTLKSRFGVRASYLGAEEKDAFEAKLARESGVPRETIRSITRGCEQSRFRAGANRNQLLLYGAGECLFMADDDTICRIAPSPRRGEQVLIDGPKDPTEFWLYEDPAAALAAAPECAADLLGLHESILGRSVSECIQGRAPEAIELGSRPGALLEALAGGASRVLISWTGLYGDSGASYPSFYLWRGAFQREQLTRSAESYARLRDSRQVFRAPERLSLTFARTLQSTAIGLDHRDCLPPFIPQERGEDIGFARIFRACFQNGLIGFLPYGIQHSPLDRRENTAEDLDRAAPLAFHPILSAVLSGFRPDRDLRDPAEGLRRLGQYLIEAAQAGATPLLARVREIRAKSIRDEIIYLERMAEAQQDLPDYWSRDLRRYVTALKAAEIQADLIPANLSAEQVVRLLTELGHGLEAWPAIFKAAQSLRQRGVQCAREA